MNPEDFISKEELLLTGWKEREIAGALDEPDEFGPSGHWLNTSGKPYFDRDRVAVAAYKIGLKTDKPLAAQWSKWDQSDKPSSLPLLTFDFHRLAEEGLRGASRQFSSLRLSHPFLGRQEGTINKERLLIEEVLNKLVMHASGVNLPTHEALYQYLSERSVQASRSFGEHWPEDVVFRTARRRSYVSKATGKKSIQQFIDAISLVHAGLVHGVDGNRAEFIDLLISSPRLRFDRRWDDDLSSIKTEHHILHRGEISDSPGKNECRSNFVRYGGDNRWELVTEATNSAGMVQSEPVRQVMGTSALVKWAVHHDKELEVGASDNSHFEQDSEEEDDKRSFGPTASRLREIASYLNASFCLACLDGWLAGNWPTPKKEPKVQILDVRGITKRAVWIRIFHAVYEVDTNLGLGYLYPPDADGYAKVVLKSGDIRLADRIVQVPKRLIPKIESLKPALELLQSDLAPVLRTP